MIANEVPLLQNRNNTQLRYEDPSEIETPRIISPQTLPMPSPPQMAAPQNSQVPEAVPRSPQNTAEIPRTKLQVLQRFGKNHRELLQFTCFIEVLSIALAHPEICFGVRSLSENSVMFTGRKGVYSVDFPTSRVKTILPNFAAESIALERKLMLLAAVRYGSQLVVHDLARNKQIFCDEPFQTVYNKSIFLDDDPPTLVSCLNNGKIIERNLELLKVSSSYTVKYPVNDIDCHAGSSLIALAMDGDPIYAFDRRTRERAMKFRGHSANSYAVKFLMNNYLVSGSDDMTSRLWDLRNPKCSVKIFESECSPVRAFEFDENRKLLYMCEQGGITTAAQIKGEITKAVVSYFGTSVGIALSPSNERVFIGTSSSKGGIICLSPKELLSQETD